MESVQAYAEPSDVAAEQGKVIVEGPDGVAVTLTPEAAEETGRRLLAAAAIANGQITAHGPKSGDISLI